jgi:3-oxoacyl-[acyl-carrier protein] reductase
MIRDVTDGAPLTGRTMVVTGGSSGIGRGIALAAARAGADIALTYRANEKGARQTAEEVEASGRRATIAQMDLADAASIEAFARGLGETFPRIDAWVNNAGADIVTPRGETLTRLDKLDMVLRVDLRGTMIASWAAAELMHAQLEGGVIINISWDHVVTGMQGTNPQLYSAAKGGVSAFSKSLARSVAPGVRVNIVAPGWIETAFGSDVDRVVYHSVASSTPLKRWGTPGDVAGAVVFLASPAASFLTGATINVGGGVVM